MGVPTEFLPAVSMPKHTFYCPSTLFKWGPVFGMVFAAFVSEFIPIFELAVLLGFALWHGFWALQYLRDPWIGDILSVRYDLRFIPFFYTKNLIRERAWTYGV